MTRFNSRLVYYVTTVTYNIGCSISDKWVCQQLAPGPPSGAGGGGGEIIGVCVYVNCLVIITNKCFIIVISAL